MTIKFYNASNFDQQDCTLHSLHYNGPKEYCWRNLFVYGECVLIKNIFKLALA